MGLDFLPLPVFTVLFVTGGIALLWHSYTSKYKYTIANRIALFLFSLECLCLPILRYYRDYNINETIENILLKFVTFTITVAFVLMCIGGYPQIKNNPQRKILYWIGISLVVIGTACLYLIFRFW